MKVTYIVFSINPGAKKMIKWSKLAETIQQVKCLPVKVSKAMEMREQATQLKWSLADG